MAKETVKEKKKLSEKTKRMFRFDTNAIVLTIAVIVVAVLLVILAEKTIPQLDATSEKLYSISDTTKNLLDKLDEEGKKIEVTVLLDRTKAESGAYTGNYDTSNIVKVLDKYDFQHDCIEVKYVDPNKNPSIVTDILGELIENEDETGYKVSTLVSDCGEGDTIVKCGDKVKIVEISDMFSLATDSSTYGFSYTYVNGVQIETVMTAALLHVTQEAAPKVYFSKGFGEKDISKFSVLTFDLEFMGYSVEEIDLASEGVPKDAAIIFFAGPTIDLSAVVTEELEEWFTHDRGCGVFMMDVDMTGTALTNFNYILSLFNLGINNDEVQEASSKSLAADEFAFKSTTLTQGAFQNIPFTEVTVEGTRSLKILMDSDNLHHREAFALVQTTKDARSVMIPSGAKEDSSMQKTVIASGENWEGTTEAKILLMGSSKNVEDNYKYGNTMSRLLLQATNWMYESTLETEATEIDAKIYNPTVVSATEKQSRWIAICCIAIYPALILAVGFIIWIKRRHL